MVITRTNQGTVNTDPAHWNRGNSAVSPNIVVKLDLTEQGTDISNTLLYSVPINGGGLYRVTSYAVITQAADTSSTMPAVAIGFADGDSLSLAGATVGTEVTTNAAGDYSSGSVVINPKPGTNINVSAVGYVTTGATFMQYAVHVSLEQIG